MNAPRTPSALSLTLQQLCDFLQQVESPLTPAEAIALSIEDWLAQARDGRQQLDRDEQNDAGDPSSGYDPADGRSRSVGMNSADRKPPLAGRGYQWKCLFLPEGSQLRMHFLDKCHYAQVVGDDIVFEGERVSPRQMTIAIAGEGRNAWRDLRVRLAGDKYWRPASALRRQCLDQDRPAPTTPAEIMQAAAASMSEALKTSRELIDHAHTLALPKFERRADRHRRQHDLMSDE